MKSNNDDYVVTINCLHMSGTDTAELLDYLGDLYAAGEVRHFQMTAGMLVTVVVAHEAVETAVYLRLRWG